ncbi:MAG: hypothetical protein EPN30_09950, partial [Actinomycetota bacterium]
MKISASKILPAALVLLVGGGIVTSGLLTGTAPVSAYSGCGYGYDNSGTYGFGYGTCPSSSSGLTPPAAPAGSTASQSASSSSASGTAVATLNSLTVEGIGAGALTIADYGNGNPTSQALSAATGQYIDIQLASGSTFTSVDVTLCNVGTGRSLSWYNGTTWVTLSPESYNPSTGCITSTLSSTSSPSLSQLGGTVIGVTTQTITTTPTSSSQGYWEVASDGGIFSFGSSTFYG